jgi:hypothetical protein
MPLKLNVGLSRKVGEANYSSRGASVHVEMELESALVQEPDKFQARIRQLFGMAKTAVDEELRNGHGQTAPGHHGNGHQGAHGQESPPATASQARALHAIANKQHLNLEELLWGRFNCGKPEEMSLKQASDLIDELNGRRNGAGANSGRG